MPESSRMMRLFSADSEQGATVIPDTARFWVPLLLLCAFTFFYHLGTPALFEPDEGRNADKAREILLLGDWVTPYTNFVPALDKPMFFYWLVAIAYKLFGVSEFSARLPSAVAGLACVIVLCLFAKKFFGSRTALWSGLILVSSVEYFLLARIVIFDMWLTLAVTLSLCAFYWAHQADKKTKKVSFYALMYVAAGVGMLVKGPIGLILPGMVIFSYLIATRKWSVLREMNLIQGAVLFLLVAAPWYVWCEVNNPGYLRYFLWEENFVRYFTPHFNRSAPPYYFLGVLLVGFIPWSLLIPVVVKDAIAKMRDDKTVFLLLWAGLPLLFFSLSSSKLPHYILPVYPPLALLTASTLVKIFQNLSKGGRWLLSLPWFTIILPLVPWAVLLYWPSLLPDHSRGPFEQVSRALPRDLILVTLLAFIPVAWASLRSWWVKWALPVSYVSLLVFLWLMVQTIEGVSQIRSSKELAERSAVLIGPEDQVAFYDTYPSSLPFYLGADRPVWIVWSGKKRSIMGSFYIAEKTPEPAPGYGEVLVTFEQFGQLWNQGKRPLRLFIEKKDLPKLIRQNKPSPKVLLDAAGFLLVSNH